MKIKINNKRQKKVKLIDTLEKAIQMFEKGLDMDINFDIDVEGAGKYNATMYKTNLRVIRIDLVKA